jgi:hypothetical protein
VDGAGDDLDVLFTGLVVEIFGAPFYRRGAMLACHVSRLLTAPTTPPHVCFLTFCAPWRSLGSQALAQSRRWDKTMIQWQCLGRTGEERCIPGTASWSSSFANLGGHVSFRLRSPCASGHLLHDVKPGIASGRAERSTGSHRTPACRKAVNRGGGRMCGQCESPVNSSPTPLELDGMEIPSLNRPIRFPQIWVLQAFPRVV